MATQTRDFVTRRSEQSSDNEEILRKRARTPYLFMKGSMAEEYTLAVMDEARKEEREHYEIVINAMKDEHKLLMKLRCGGKDGKI